MSEDKLTEHSGTFISTRYSPEAYSASRSLIMNGLATLMGESLADLLGVFKPFIRTSYCTIGNYDLATVRLDILRLPDNEFDRFCMAYMLTILSSNSELFNTGDKGWGAVHLLQRQLEQFYPLTLTFRHSVYEMIRKIGYATCTTADLKHEYELQKNREQDELSVWNQTGRIPDDYLVKLFQRTLGKMDIDFTTISSSTRVPMINFEAFKKTLMADGVSRQALYIAFCTGVRNVTTTDPRLPTDIRRENLTRTDFYIPEKEPT